MNPKDRRGQVWEEDWEELNKPSQFWLVIGHDGRNHLLLNLETAEQSCVWEGAFDECADPCGWTRLA